MTKKKTPLERFSNKYQINSLGCWIWTACKNQNGYGDFFSGSRKTGHHLAHRASWKLHRGDIPDGLGVLHKCDTPACVNPDHLFLGTQKDNAKDAMKKGRLKGLIQPGQNLNKRPYAYQVVMCYHCSKEFLKMNCRIRKCPTHFCSRGCFRNMQAKAAAMKQGGMDSAGSQA